MKKIFLLIIIGFLIMTLATTSIIWDIPPIYKIKAARFQKVFADATREYGLPEKLLERVAYQESRFNPLAYNKRSGAKGMMQFMDSTAREYGLNDPYDPEQSIYAAAKYLKWLRSKTNSWAEALAAYNWGIGNLRRKGIQNAPEETREYYASITRDLNIV